MMISSHAADLGVHRLNFFPDADAWLRAEYSHRLLNITTPKEIADTKDVRNVYNLGEVSYAQRFARKLFLGVKVGIEEASENGALYGIPLKRRFTSEGLTDPEIFGTYRLRHQKDDKGNLDLHLSLTPSPGNRKISTSSTNRFSGRNSVQLGLSHGFLDEAWEFRNAIHGTFLGAGREDNEFLGGMRFRLESSFTVDYTFSAQYASGKRTFVSGLLGINYRSSEISREKGGGKRELRSGTGSVFGASLKRIISDWSLLEGGYTLRRSEYFVKGEDVNLDGKLTSHEFSLAYLILF